MLDTARISISDNAHQQYVVVHEDIKKLCELTHMGWDLTSIDLFDAVRKVSFAEGVICGAALIGVVVMVRKIKKLIAQLDDE